MLMKPYPSCYLCAPWAVALFSCCFIVSFWLRECKSFSKDASTEQSIRIFKKPCWVEICHRKLWPCYSSGIALIYQALTRQSCSTWTLSMLVIVDWDCSFLSVLIITLVAIYHSVICRRAGWLLVLLLVSKVYYNTESSATYEIKNYFLSP